MKYSIITPTYNREDLIARAIQSILAQTHEDFELIIVDDASTDNTIQVVESFLYDKRIKLIKSEVNGGVNKARNIGLDAISDQSEAVTFLDSDDEFEPDALENMLAEMNLHKEINYFRFGVKYEDGKYANDLSHVGVIGGFDYYIKNLFTIGEWVCTFRRNIIDNGFKYSTEVKAFEIIPYITLARQEDVFFSDKVVRKYYTGHESISNQKFSKEKLANTIKGYEIILDTNSDIKNISPKIFSVLNHTLANLYMLEGKKGKGLKLTGKAFLANPFDLRLMRNLINFIIK
ncbi:MAG: glycosyltransferase family 2 protein [Flavobacterium lindanitolerans]|jgi:glycosyltransferase involved in cell wall biosynthesis|uniref:glycosyltransferase family 2 protein n=1 Tax=Flavobacterium lindanitolerans TaxID=428988 RepID=UPI001A4AA229|nr:glycosyltransferase family 2 protein [Flavobacterium lindanitolerans]MBL7866520.1 glycosyltransferase family 2 protein [Flavobacterium lindanitolerans]